jgi:Tol biopolymer transport system component
MGTHARIILLLALAVMAFVAGGWAGASSWITERVSVRTDGSQGTGDSGAWGRPAINVGGRFVAFESFATNLVWDDTNNASDIFLRDRGLGTTNRVSLSNGGSQANGFSFQPVISGDGRYVAFDSDATNLVPGDTNAASDVFVRDRQAGSTIRVSVASDGAQASGASFQPAISSDGRYVAFYSEAANLVVGDTNGVDDVFVRDRDTDGDGTFDEGGAVSTTRVSTGSGGQANGLSGSPAISGDGQYVTFVSEASNLVADDTNNFCDTDGDTALDDNCPDVFVRNRQAGTTQRVSVDSANGQGNSSSYAPAISWEGRFVTFTSAATNLVAGDTNAATDIFLRDRLGGTTERVSLASGGSQSNGPSSVSGLSSDGRYAVFQSEASNLVTGDTNGSGDIFVRDRARGATTRVSVDSGGGQADGGSSAPGISSDGQYVVFYSVASNLVSGDTNGRQDVFFHDLVSAVGGIAELPDVSDPSGANYGGPAALAAAAATLAVAAMWYARRRLKQG